jgi:enoyl-CoA hydratase
MAEAPIRCSRDGAVAHVEFARPETMNALTFAGLAELAAHVEQLARDTSVRCLVLTSTGKHFTSGMHLDEFFGGSVQLDVATSRSRFQLRENLTTLMRQFDVLDAAPFPVIAAIQGGCIGGGVDLVAACDLRLCSADAFFSIQEINVGLVADLGTLQRLPKLIPPGVVREYAYTGRRMTADKALAVGLVNSVHATHEELREAAFALAREIAQKSPLAIAGTKVAINYARDHGTREALDHMAVLQAAILSPDDMRAAIEAVRTKQAPAFPDR